MSIYSDASFIISASGGYKEGDATPTAGKLYNLKPDGATYPAMDVTGGGNAVSQNSDGTWQINWPVNTPRFSWIDGVPSILAESQRQNLITYPRSFDNAYWNKTGATVDDNAGAGYACPFVDASGVNTNEAYKLIATANDATLKLTTPFTTAAASPYVNSLFIKRVAGTGVVSLIDVNDTDRAVTLTSEWQRFDVEAVAAGVTGQIGIKLATAGDEVMICHAQPELGASASSPIYGAEGSVLTRLTDVVSIATDISSTKTLIINDDAYIVETALPDNGYYLPQIPIERLILSDSVLSDVQIADLGCTKRQLAFASYVNIAAGVTASIAVDGVGYIDWGDGNTSTYSSQVALTHTYAEGYKGLIKFVGTLTYLNSSSNINWYFDIANLPVDLNNFYCAGSNTVTGDIANLSVNLNYFVCAGSNTVTGDIANLPVDLIYFLCSGSNTVTGDIANLPVDLNYFYCIGSNTVTGDIANLPVDLIYFLCAGSNTVTGDIANLPVDIIYFYCFGSNTVSDYTSGRIWANNQNRFYIRQTAGFGLSSSEVDNLLIDLANVVSWEGNKQIDISGNNAARTSASDTAVATLQSKGVTVTTN